jgi:hypothetical protein
MAVEAAANALITLAEIKRWLLLSGTDTTRDDFLQEAINEWSDTIETRLGRKLLSQEHAEERHHGGKVAILLKNIPVTDISEITVDGAALGSSDYTYDGASGIVRMVGGNVFGGGPGSVLVTYTGGFTTAPGDLKRAMKQITAIEYYLSGHGRRSIAKTAESAGDGSVSYNRGPEEQERIMRKLERTYSRR